MKMIDFELGHYVAELENDVLTSRYGHKFSVQGCAVVDDDEVVGTFIDGVFANRFGKRLAIAGYSLI